MNMHEILKTIAEDPTETREVLKAEVDGGRDRRWALVKEVADALKEAENHEAA